MQEFNEGDLVEVSRGEEVHRGRWHQTAIFGCLSNVNLDWDDLDAEGWAVDVIEKAAPKLPSLPTDRGYYTSEAESRAEGVLQLDFTGRWWWIGNKYQPSPESIQPSEVAKHGDLTRLEPVPVTAKKVLDAIRGRIGSIDSAYDFQAVAAQFGVAL